MNFNPFNKPPLNKIFKNNTGNGNPETPPIPSSPESESNILSRLMMIASFLTVMGSAEASSPALRDFGSFNEMQTKSKTEFVKLNQKMKDLGTDTIRYDVGNKKMTVINHDGGITYVEIGGGNTITIDDVNGDGVADKIKVQGYIDGTQTIQGDPETAKRKGEMRDVEHIFSKDIEKNSSISVNSTMNLTKMEEVKVFVSVQDKFVQGIEGAVQSTQGGTMATAQK